MPLTARQVEAIKADPARRRFAVPDDGRDGERGLTLVVQPSGTKSWVFNYRMPGDRAKRKTTLGVYPALSLADARIKARQAWIGVKNGIDPQAVKQEARAAAQAVEDDRDQVSVVYALYLRRQLGGPEAGADADGHFRRDILPAWGKRKMRDIRKRDVVELIDGIVERGSPYTANNCLAYVKAFFTWAKGRDVVDSNPAEAVPPPAPKRSRDRILDDDELRAFWAATGRMGQPFGPLYRLLLLTGVRLREGAEMIDREIRDGIWTIPPERSKNGEAHRVPLSAAARQVLDGVMRVGRAGLLFTTNGTSAVSGFAKAKARLDRLMNEDREKDDPIPAFVIHDLRRTAASGMARIGIAPHVIEACLGHKTGAISGLAAVYNRHRHEEEKAAALESWGRFVLDLVGEGDAERKVIRLDAARQIVGTGEGR